MSDPLPTVYHGIPSSDEDTRIVQDALQEIVARLNEVPEGDLALRVIVSVLVSVCCAQSNPGAAFQIIGANVAAAINGVMIEPQGPTQ